MGDYDDHKSIRFLRWFCKSEYLDEIEGDLIELYELRASEDAGKAKRRLWRDVIRSFRWVNLKKVNTQHNSVSMFNNYLKVGLRNLIRDFRFTIINLLGLSVGLSIFLLMIMMIKHEQSFDTFHSKAHRTFQVIQEFRQSDGADPEIWTPRPLSDALQTEVAGVAHAISLQGAASNWVEVAGKRFFEEDGIIAGANFFEIFDFELIAGNRKEALSNKRSTVISESLSKKYFGFDNAIGKTIEHEFYGPFTVTGVMKEVPGNSYLQFDYLLTQDLDTYFENVASWYEPWFKSWQGHGVSTFVVLEEAIASGEIESQISQLIRKNLAAEEVNDFQLLGMLDLHFGSNGIDGRINQHIKGDLQKVQLFSLVAAVIIIMACFNYINITTARSVKRHKEVGVRKSVGAFRTQVMVQFLTESFLLVVFSMSVSLCLSYLLVPIFNEIVGLNLTYSWDLISDAAPWIIGAMLFVTLCSGLYPAFVLSKTSSLVLVQGKAGTHKQGGALRNSLVTVQFMAVIVIAACLLVINDQYEYMSEKALGLNTEEIVVVEINSGPVRSNYQTIKQELQAHPAIKDVTGITRVFSGYRSPVAVIVNTLNNSDNPFPMKYYGVDQEALEVFGLELVAGEGFTGISGLDSTSVILNETAANQFGGSDVIGKWVELQEDQGDHGAELKARVVGIVKDFHFESLHQPIKPTVIGYYKSPFESLDDIIIKIDGNQMQKALAHIEEIHNAYDTNKVMDWAFLDDMKQNAYEDEVIFRDVMTIASMISLFVALLGMIGMVSYNVISRTKEFGIRKVLGASFGHLMIVQAKAFIKYLLIAAIFSIPLAWWTIGLWLENYAFRIAITPIHFMLILIGLFTLIGATVFLIGRNNFRQNPVKSLRYE